VWNASEIILDTSDGRTAGPFQESQQVDFRTNLYVSQARRSAILAKSGEVEKVEGIKVYRYRMDARTVANADTYEPK